MSKKILSIIFIVFIVLIIFLFYRYLTISQRKNVPQPTPQPTAKPQVVRKPEELPIVRKDEKTGKEIVEIPFNYIVKTVDQEKIVLQKPGGGENDIITYPKESFSVIKVFKNLPEGTISARLSDIAVGQKIKVRNINRGQEIQFYIINP